MRKTRDEILLAPLVLLAIASVFRVPAASADDWPQWRGPSRNGISAESVWPARWKDGEPERLWTREVGIGFSSLAVASGRVYTLGNKKPDDVVSCLDARSGAVIWEHRYASELGAYLYEGGPGATPTVDGDHVFTLGRWGHVFCLDAASGKVIWRRDLRTEESVKPNEWGLAGSPLVHGDLVILNAGSSGVALERRSGKTVWLNGTQSTGYASPVLFQPKAAAKPAALLFAARALVAVEPATGKELWRHAWKTGYDNNNADPVISGEKIFITTYDRGAACLTASAARVELLWDRRVMNTHMAPPILVGEHLYGFSGHHARRPDFRCVHLSTGEVMWREHGLAAGSVMLADGKLLILDGKGTLVIAKPNSKSFEELARAAVARGRCWTPPALAHGLLYVRNSRGELRCIRLGGESAATDPKSSKTDSRH